VLVVAIDATAPALATTLPTATLAASKTSIENALHTSPVRLSTSAFQASRQAVLGVEHDCVAAQ
jgi:hypothetical protein